MENNNILITFLNGNIWFNCITLILSVAAIPMTIWIFYQSNKKKLPTYMLRTISLVAGKVQTIKSIHIKYQDQEINNLAITKLALWNDGKDTIKADDFAKNGPLKIIIDNNYQILDYELLYQKQPKNNFNLKLSKDKKAIDISFEYFSYLEGVIIQIYHTGHRNSNIELEGQIKSNQKINRKTTNSILIPYLFESFLRKIRPKLIRKIIGWSMLIVGLLAAIYCTSLYFGDTESIINKISQYKGPIYFFFSIIVSFLYIYMGYKILKKRIPKGFDIFDDEF